MVQSGKKVLARWIKVLIGEYEHSLDAKGRLIMPAKLREDMGEKFILTTGLDGIRLQAKPQCISNPLYWENTEKTSFDKRWILSFLQISFYVEMGWL